MFKCVQFSFFKLQKKVLERTKLNIFKTNKDQFQFQRFRNTSKLLFAHLLNQILQMEPNTIRPCKLRLHSSDSLWDMWVLMEKGPMLGDKVNAGARSLILPALFLHGFNLHVKCSHQISLQYK